MNAPSLRLGDVIDDYCPRCKLLLNHAVASLVGDKVVKVVCQTCHTEHPYRNAAVPPKKKRAVTPARYISRHSSRPPRGTR
jgi:cytochrome c5